MKRRISSLQTFLVKVILPLLWVPMFGIATLAMFRSGEPPRWIFLFVWIAGSTIMYWNGVRLKEVSVDDSCVYASNYLKEISIPFSEIRDITENVWINTHPVTIHLKAPSEFGVKIVFMPKTRFFALYSSHPVVNELKQLVSSRGRGAGSFR